MCYNFHFILSVLKMIWTIDFPFILFLHVQSSALHLSPFLKISVFRMKCWILRRVKYSASPLDGKLFDFRVEILKPCSHRIASKRIVFLPLSPRFLPRGCYVKIAGDPRTRKPSKVGDKHEREAGLPYLTNTKTHSRPIHLLVFTSRRGAFGWLRILENDTVSLC